MPREKSMQAETFCYIQTSYLSKAHFSSRSSQLLEKKYLKGVSLWVIKTCDCVVKTVTGKAFGKKNIYGANKKEVNYFSLFFLIFSRLSMDKFHHKLHLVCCLQML